MNKKIGPISLSDIRRFGSEFSSLGQEYILARVEPGDFSSADIISPCRFDGVTIVLMLNASGSVTINLETLEVPRYSIMVIDETMPVNLHCDDVSDMEAYLLFLSKDFLESVNIDTNAIGRHPFHPENSPVLKLSEENTALIQKYLGLLRDNAEMPDESHYRINIARNLIANIFYILLEIERQNRNNSDDADKAPRSRRINYVTDFLRLVRQNFREQRSVGYYADRLYITPKYLSLVIKETTGRSAAQWIGRHVIIEAKNLLRFSGKNIQQIAYELNFPNQSSFGKYFKHNTGMSPSEFQKS